MKIVHISPVYFDPSSIIGGGERYVSELSQFMARRTDVTLVSFSSRRESFLKENLHVELFPAKIFIKDMKINPLSFSYLSRIFQAEIVHIHVLNSLVSDMGCMLARLLGKPVFVTDYGGGTGMVLNRFLPIKKWYRAAIAYSQFMCRTYPQELQNKIVLIKGGIDLEKYSPGIDLRKEKKILFVGRLLPHKGIDYLIKAHRLLGRQDILLRILGRVHDENYFALLQDLAKGYPVEFIHDADDARLVHEYQTALVTVLPSVHTTCYGTYTTVPELMGFTLLESQACGTPVVCTDAGAMKEFLEPGKTGFVVKQNSGEALAEALARMMDLSSEDYKAYATRSRKWVEQFHWCQVVEDYLKVYQGVKSDPHEQR